MVIFQPIYLPGTKKIIIDDNMKDKISAEIHKMIILKFLIILLVHLFGVDKAEIMRYNNRPPHPAEGSTTQPCGRQVHVAEPRGRGQSCGGHRVRGCVPLREDVEPRLHLVVETVFIGG